MMSRRNPQKNNRSEQVRKRLEKRISAGRKAPKGEDARKYAHQAPPVVMRGGKAWAPVRPQPVTRATPRKNVRIGKFTEVRLPVLPRIRFTWQWISGPLAAFFIAVIWTFVNSPTYQVEAAQVENLQRYTEHEVNLTLQLSGQSVFALDPAVIQNDIQEAFPEFSEARVFINLPNRVLIKVEERVPILIWESSEGDYWVDQEGYAFLIREDLAPLPVFQADLFGELAPVHEEDDAQVSIFGGKQLLTPELVASLLTLRTTAAEGATLLYDPLYGLGWYDPGGWPVYFGKNGDEIQPRLVVYEALLNHFENQGVRPTFVSVVYPDAPFYRSGE